MVGLMQRVLGSHWDRLPPALQAHYRAGTTVEEGRLDVEFPGFMIPVLAVLALVGALLRRRGRQLPTVVERRPVEDRVHWRRRITYPDGHVAAFDSEWVAAGDGELIEYVNPLLGLRMAVSVDGQRLKYRGICYVLRLGRLQLSIPNWMALGRVDIDEVALDASRYEMDFRLQHPLFGQIFRYSGTFTADARSE